MSDPDTAKVPVLLAAAEAHLRQATQQSRTVDVYNMHVSRSMACSLLAIATMMHMNERPEYDEGRKEERA